MAIHIAHGRILEAQSGKQCHLSGFMQSSACSSWPSGSSLARSLRQIEIDFVIHPDQTDIRNDPMTSGSFTANWFSTELKTVPGQPMPQGLWSCRKELITRIAVDGQRTPQVSAADDEEVNREP